MLTGDASNADPVCSKSDHGVILKAREEAEHTTQTIEQLAFRNAHNSRLIAKVR
jgi:pyrroloquinoline quinone biosynthesis protein E